MSVVAELDTILQSMLKLKAPGANGQTIAGATTLCTANIKSEDVLVQKLYTHLKKAPSNYKLGALYVVDSIARHWLEAAKRAGQELGQPGSHGTFAAGVNRITELLPSLMDDLIRNAPDEHKAKIEKLIDIWRRSGTFPANLIATFDTKLKSTNGAYSTTPTGTPPQSAVSLAANAFASAAPTNEAVAQPASNNLEETLKALAGLAQTGAPASAPTQVPTPVPASNPLQLPQSMPVNGASMQYPAVGQQQPQQSQQQQQPDISTLFGGNNPLAALLGQQQQQQQQPQQQQYPQHNGYPGMQQSQQQQPPMPGVAAGMPGMNSTQPDMIKQIQILGQLKAMNVPQEQWAQLLPLLMNMPQQAGAGGAPPAGMPLPTNQGSYGAYTADQSRDSSGYEQMRSPNGRDSGRRRSRSPDRRGGRDSPSYDRYDKDRGDRDGRRGGRGRDRRRSPERFRRTPSPRGGKQNQSQGANDSKYPLPEPGPKKIEYDPSLPKDSIRVYSRTLFVGGVTCSEDELRQIFANYGRVQTCIVNIDKRHAFVKMISREEAEVAKEQMEHLRHETMQLRTRWGVGYGPRDCSDYSTGVSVIPISRLTDADRKWMLSAEFGGSGGKPIETGLVVEEPDIEIGAGVSSKAISRRMQTDRSGQHGPRSTKDQGGSNGSNGKWGRSGRGEDENPNNISIAPQVPGYGQFDMSSLGQAGSMNFGQNY